ncbi:hypothetical protein Scipio_00006 [Acinetobacter phage Scipio]|nr:hypothetical protein Scipio_00006 [Acinetobacter phage Scipio]
MQGFNSYPTREKVQDDFNKLKELHAYFNSMSDDEIAPINEDFYSTLEMVKEIAVENNLNEDDAYSYYKLAIWLEMHKQNQ